MVEYENYRKSHQAIQLPVFNLLDPSSALTWLELRALMRDVGDQYKFRLVIQAFISTCIIVALWAAIFAHMYGLLSIELRPDEWIVFVILLLDQTVPFIGLMFAMAFMNSETENQIKQFNEIRFFINRLSTDSDIMISGPKLSNQALNRLVRYYKTYE